MPQIQIAVTYTGDDSEQGRAIAQALDQLGQKLSGAIDTAHELLSAIKAPEMIDNLKEVAARFGVDLMAAAERSQLQLTDDVREHARAGCAAEKV